MKYHQEILYAKYHFDSSVGQHSKFKTCSETVKNIPKSAKCALSKVLLHIAMAMLVR